MCNCDCELDKRDRWAVDAALTALKIGDWLIHEYSGPGSDLFVRRAAQRILNGDWDEPKR